MDIPSFVSVSQPLELCTPSSYRGRFRCMCVCKRMVIFEVLTGSILRLVHSVTGFYLHVDMCPLTFT